MTHSKLLSEPIHRYGKLGMRPAWNILVPTGEGIALIKGDVE
jgi:hypothetical protein